MTWRTVVLKPDLEQPGVARVELDQRSREARLRLERVEQLLVVRLLPKQSLLKRMLRRLGSRIFAGAHLGGRSAGATLTARQPCQKDEVRDEINVTTVRSCTMAQATSTSTT